MQRRHRAWILAAVLIGVVGVGLVSALRKDTSELPVYTTGAERMRHGEAIYRHEDAKPFTYPPFFAIPFLPLLALPDGAHRAVFYLGNVAALALVIALLHRGLRRAEAYGAAPRRWVFWAVVGALAGRHVLAVFQNQSHDLLVFLLVMTGVAASARLRETRAGVWAGIGAACKATPLLFLPVYLWQRRFAAGLAVLVAAIALTFLPDLAFPQADGTSWARSWFDTFAGRVRPGEAATAGGAWSSWNQLNQSLSGTIHRLSTPIEPDPRFQTFDVSVWNPDRGVLRLVTIGAQLAVLALVAFSTRRGASRGLSPPELAFRRLGEGGVVVCAMVLLSPMSSKAHFCVLLLPIAVMAADYLYRGRDPVLLALLVSLLLLGPLTSKGVVGILGPDAGTKLLARGTVTACALICLAGTAHVLHHRTRAARTAAPA